jgi:chromosomal replication initiation ATPase DnaA
MDNIHKEILILHQQHLFIHNKHFFHVNFIQKSFPKEIHLFYFLAAGYQLQPNFTQMQPSQIPNQQSIPQQSQYTIPAGLQQQQQQQQTAMHPPQVAQHQQVKRFLNK